MSSRFLLRRRSRWIASFVTLIALSGCGGSTESEETVQVAPDGTVQPGPTAVVGSGSNVKADATKLVEQAAALIQTQKFGDAVKTLNEAIKLDPESAEAFFQRAGILADAGRDQLAANDYTKAIELNPDEVRYHNMRGLFLLTRKQHELALTDFTAAITIDPKYVQAWNNRGLVRLAQGEYQKAIDDFNKAVEVDPQYADGFNNRGFAWYQAGVDDRALADFDYTIELKPEYVNAWNNRGMLHMRMQKYRDAVEDFSKAIAQEENNVKHYRNRLAAYLQLGMQDRSDADAERVAWLTDLTRLNLAVSQEPQKPDGYIQRASHLARDGRHEIALANFDQAVKIAPDSIKPLVSRASYWLEQGELNKAIADAASALMLGYDQQAHSIRGEAFLKLGKFDEAIDDFTEARRLDSSVAQAYFKRAVQRNERGDAQGAAADVEQARRIDPAVVEDSARQ